MAINNREDKKNDVLQVAMRYFSELGYEKTKLLDIANEVGISTTTLYSFFKINMNFMKVL